MALWGRVWNIWFLAVYSGKTGEVGELVLTVSLSPTCHSGTLRDVHRSMKVAFIVKY
jgi:hypothetical protein